LEGDEARKGGNLSWKVRKRRGGWKVVVGLHVSD